MRALYLCLQIFHGKTEPSHTCALLPFFSSDVDLRIRVMNSSRLAKHPSSASGAHTLHARPSRSSLISSATTAAGRSPVVDDSADPAVVAVMRRYDSGRVRGSGLVSDDSLEFKSKADDQVEEELEQDFNCVACAKTAAVFCDCLRQSCGARSYDVSVKTALLYMLVTHVSKWYAPQVIPLLSSVSPLGACRML